MSQNVIPPQATSSLTVWLDYLNTIHSTSIDLGLERVERVAKQAKLTKPAPFTITVAGTNGKGSTCALMEAILLDAGYKVGVYSSPHLIRYNERVRINGVDAADKLHVEAFDFVERARGETTLSLFEFGTLAALRIFQVENVDVVLLEVGLGGRLDATNVVEHDVSVITSLAIDHVDWLGSDINVIGYEKAGIFRPGKPAICGQPQAPATVAAHADDIGADLHQVGIQYNYKIVNDTTWQWNSGPYNLDDLPIPQLPLPNAATALIALGSSELEISDINIVNGLKNARLAGRMQVIQRDPVVLFDVAHNPHSAHYLAEKIAQQYPNQTVRMVIAMLHDKDIKSTLAELEPITSFWYVASLTGPRAAKASELCEHLSDNFIAFAKPVTAFKAALTNAAKDDVIIVAGSFHTVGEVLEYWQQQGE